jgi:hypothetical protein
MFRRLVFENSAALFTLAAFITAVSIYVTITWRALRMKRSQVARFENLPFETETPAAGRPPLAGPLPPDNQRRPHPGAR